MPSPVLSSLVTPSLRPFSAFPALVHGIRGHGHPLLCSPVPRPHFRAVHPEIRPPHTSSRLLAISALAGKQAPLGLPSRAHIPVLCRIPRDGEKEKVAGRRVRLFQAFRNTQHLPVPCQLIEMLGVPLPRRAGVGGKPFGTINHSGFAERYGRHREAKRSRLGARMCGFLARNGCEGGGRRGVPSPGLGESRGLPPGLMHWPHLCLYLSRSPCQPCSRMAA